MDNKELHRRTGEMAERVRKFLIEQFDDNLTIGVNGRIATSSVITLMFQILKSEGYDKETIMAKMANWADDFERRWNKKNRKK
jgi:hypothetical protein